jgi:hypothetical protein
MKKLGLSIFIATCAWSLALMAQDSPKLWVVHFDEVTPEKVELYEEALGGWVAAFKEAKLEGEFQWYTSSGSDFTYVTGWPLKSFADLDREEEFEKKVREAIGETKIKELRAKEASAIHSHHSEIVRHVAELSYGPGM